MQGSYPYFFKQREDRASISECESCILQQCEVRIKYETRILSALKCEARVMSVSEYEAHVSNSKLVAAFQHKAMAAFQQSNVRLAFSIACLQDIRCQKALTLRGSRLVPPTLPRQI